MTNRDMSTDAQILRAAIEVIRAHPQEVADLGFDDGGEFTCEILLDLAEAVQHT